MTFLYCFVYSLASIRALLWNTYRMCSAARMRTDTSEKEKKSGTK